jgi:hypothetical protein
MNHERRLRRLEAWRQRQKLTAMAAEVGLTVDELLEEAHEFFSLPLAEQLAEVDRIAPHLQAEGMTMDGIDDIKADLARYYRP